VINLIPPMIYNGIDFGDFKGDSRPSSRATDAFLDSHFEQQQQRSLDTTSDRKSPSVLLETPTEGRVRFADRQIAVTEFSDDEETYRQSKLDIPTLTTPEISARRPHSGSKSSSPGKQRKEKGGATATTVSARKASNQSSQKHSKSSSTLPSIIGLNEDKPKVPFDTMKALQGTEYRPKSPKHMINIERSFSNA
jgi:hypothetical protein